MLTLTSENWSQIGGEERSSLIIDDCFIDTYTLYIAKCLPVLSVQLTSASSECMPSIVWKNLHLPKDYHTAEGLCAAHLAELLLAQSWRFRHETCDGNTASPQPVHMWPVQFSSPLVTTVSLWGTKGYSAESIVYGDRDKGMEATWTLEECEHAAV